MERLTDDAKTNRYVQSVIKRMIDYILDEIYKLNQEQIDKIVYAAYNPVEYERTYEFRDAWKKSSEVVVNNKTGKGVFEYNPEGMVYNQGNAQHGSYYDPPGDARQYLADIIYQGLSGPAYGNGPINGPWAEARDAFSALLDATDGKMDVWIREFLSNEDMVVT